LKTLYLIRGIPGSGKTTMAREMGLEHHYEADMWFERNVPFKKELLGVAHEWCKQRVGRAMLTGQDIVVSNTFIRKWEMDAYFDLAFSFGYTVIIKIASGNYENVHGCTKETVDRMRESFEV
jgi:predicted kinase